MDRMDEVTVGGDANETGSVTKKKGKNLQPVSVLVLPRTSGIKRRATTTTSTTTTSTTAFGVCSLRDIVLQRCLERCNGVNRLMLAYTEGDNSMKQVPL